MVAKYSVGKSSYGDLRGVTQYVASERMALQVLSTIIDFNAYLRSKKRTGSLSVNEGMRSRPRQDLLYRQYLQNRYPVAAVPYTSRHDEVLRGNAVDFGVTNADGSNRALSADEFTRLHEIVQGRGGTWTGVNFGEPWHHEMATRAEAVPPYADARTRVNPPPKKPTKTAVKKPPIASSPGGLLMLFKAKYWYVVGEFTVTKYENQKDAEPYSHALKRSTPVTSERMRKIISDTAERRKSVFGSIDTKLQQLLDDRNL